MSETVIRPAGDSSLLVEFENEISLEVNYRVQALKHTLEESPFEGMGEMLPTYRSLLVFYDPLKIRWKQACEKVRAEYPDYTLQTAMDMDFSEVISDNG